MPNVLDLKRTENKLTQEIIACAMRTHKNLGVGLLQSIYEECMCIELAKSHLHYERQKNVSLVYEGVTLHNTLKLDLLVENEIIIELKSVEKITPLHEAQLLIYLKLSEKNLGLLINFNVDLLKNGLKRIVNNFPSSADSINSAPPRL